jgi:2-amino-4-hydroxy-6-hydroxymethyldihydropteridine diphosphokinase
MDGLEVVACSSVYETEAMDDAAGQRDFYNAAIEVRTTLDAGRLLAACKEIEQRLGREPDPLRHAPRPIDVDLLLLDELRLSEPNLVLPHPDIAIRRFVLVPLVELDSDLRLPGGQRLADALAALGDSQRVDGVGALA